MLGVSEVSDVVDFARDLAERAGWTFVQSAAPSFAAVQLTSWNELKAAAVAGSVAGAAAVLSLLKGVLAGTRTGSASTLKREAIATAKTSGVAVLEELLDQAERIAPLPKHAEPVVDYSRNPNN